MLRLFTDTYTRAAASLDGLWDFVTEPERTDRAKLPKTYTRKILVPSAWESVPGLENYRGRAWFRTTFSVGHGGNARFVFGGVSHTADVYVDGKHVAHHYDAFTPFDAVVSGLDDGEPHELVVEVDNSFGDHSALHLENDYYTYGGITRPVEIQQLHADGVFIERILAVPVRKRGGSWDLDVRVRVRNIGPETARRSLDCMIETAKASTDAFTIKAGTTVEKSLSLSCGRVNAWSPESPSLHTLAAILLEGDIAGDIVCDRIGFREVTVKGKKLLLNGEPVRLRGYNRHEDHPQFGCAIPVEAMMRDLDTIRDLGCNFVRTSHYPNDMRFLDLCDELGVLVWEESHARQVKFDHPKYREQITDSTTEMVEWHHNRPSIIIWGCLNECESTTKKGREEHLHVLRLLKKLDPSRPRTFASMYYQADLCLDEVDIVSFNRYSAWYGEGLDSVEPFIRNLLKWLHSSKSDGRGKPLVISECGAGAVPGVRNANRAKWTEEYQADVLDRELEVYLNIPDIVGVALWQFCDVRVTPGFWSNRPRTMNNKGTVDEYRRPKLAYETVKRRMLEAAEAERSSPKRSGKKKRSKTSGRKKR